MDYRLNLVHGTQIQVACTHVPSQVTPYSAQILIFCGNPHIFMCSTSVCNFYFDHSVLSYYTIHPMQRCTIYFIFHLTRRI